jgi:hypothetical protein
MKKFALSALLFAGMMFVNSANAEDMKCGAGMKCGASMKCGAAMQKNCDAKKCPNPNCAMKKNPSAKCDCNSKGKMKCSSTMKEIPTKKIETH